MPTSFVASRDVIIRTQNLQQAVHFYESVLGLPIVHRSQSLIGFDAGALRLYVEQGPEHGPVLEFIVDDFQAAKDSLIAAGCVIQEEAKSVPRCYLRDPYGLVFNIQQRTA